ncbi:MAG: hypothetical protein B5M55_01190 [Desulfococcus sp. 4484_242]|nr:MAG: hypothetical protein B5M55_01190 [Desulfococcus sp. 4484_242]
MKESYQLDNSGDNSERSAGAGGFFFCPPGSRVRKTLLPRVIELLREANDPKFDQKSAVNGYWVLNNCGNHRGEGDSYRGAS